MRMMVIFSRIGKVCGFISCLAVLDWRFIRWIGNEYQAVVEFAPYQKVPSAAKNDNRQGTIDDGTLLLLFSLCRYTTFIGPPTLHIRRRLQVLCSFSLRAGCPYRNRRGASLPTEIYASPRSAHPVQREGGWREQAFGTGRCTHHPLAHPTTKARRATLLASVSDRTYRGSDHYQCWRVGEGGRKHQGSRKEVGPPGSARDTFDF